MRRPASVKRAGPYEVSSCADGTLIITPDWPQFRKWTEEDGGGPGVISRLGLAHNLEAWLNNAQTLDNYVQQRYRPRLNATTPS